MLVGKGLLLKLGRASPLEKVEVVASRTSGINNKHKYLIPDLIVENLGPENGDFIEPTPSLSMLEVIRIIHPLFLQQSKARDCQSSVPWLSMEC